MSIIKSQKPDINLPHLDILSLLFESKWTLAKEETKIHIEAANPSNSIIKSEARDLTKRLAYVLRSRHGIGSQVSGGDVVLFIGSGSPFCPILFYSIVAAGGVFSGASTAYHIGEIVRQIRDADARLLTCSVEYQALTVEAAKRCGLPVENVLVIDSKAPKRWTLRSTDGTDVLRHGSGEKLDWQRITEQQQLQDTTVALLYSSGTTGLPKGVRLSHWGILSSCICTMDVARRYKARHDDFTFNTIAHLPMANIAGIDLYCMNPFYMGGSTYWMEKYDFHDFIEYNRRYRPAYIFTVPPIWLRIAKSDEVTDHFDGLRVAVTGSAPIGPATAKEVTTKLGRGKAIIVQTWGITEATGVITALDWLPGDGIWSVGDICPNVRLRIVDDDDNDIDIDSGRPGEMLVGGPILSQGYHNRPDATHESFTNDGFYRTGDIGMYKNGHVWIIDRKKELIKYKGQQVAPAELEALLTSHSQIADAAVIGIWDGRQETEVPRAYLVRRQVNESSTDKELLTAHNVAEFVKTNLAAHKQLRGGVVFVDEIPKSASGKILRKQLRQRASEESRARL